MNGICRARWAAVLCGVALLAGCAGTAAPPAVPTATSAVGAVSDGAFPATITTNQGEVTIPAAPQRVVSLLAPYTDVALALDAPLVGVADFSLGGGTFPWLAGRPGLAEATTFPDPYSPIDVERIAALTPDLILASDYQVPDRAAYDRLSAIAPTFVALGPSSSNDAWQDTTRAIGTLLGRSAQAEQLVTDVESAIRATAAASPGITGRTAVYVAYFAGGFLPVTGPQNPAVRLLADLGLTLPPGLAGRPDQQTLSVENTAELDADLLLYVIQDGSSLDAAPGWAALRPVRGGTAQELDLNAAVALIGPSVLSIPYVLEQLTPVLNRLGSTPPG